MKRILCLFLVCVLGCSLCACSKSGKETPQQNASTQNTNSSVPFYKVGDSFTYNDLIKIEISSLDAVKSENKIVATLKFTNISGQDLDVSRYFGFREIVVGDPEQYETDGGFGLGFVEKRRDFINNDKKEEDGILRAEAKMMALYEFTFFRDSDSFYEDFGDFFDSVNNITFAMEPWYLKSDTSAEKAEPIIFEMDFKNLYAVLNSDK